MTGLPATEAPALAANPHPRARIAPSIRAGGGAAPARSPQASSAHAASRSRPCAAAGAVRSPAPRRDGTAPHDRRDDVAGERTERRQLAQEQGAMLADPANAQIRDERGADVNRDGHSIPPQRVTALRIRW